MNARKPMDIARMLVAADKGLLGMDESNSTCNKRFALLGIPETEDARRAYREVLVTKPGLGGRISDTVLYVPRGDRRRFRMTAASETRLLPGTPKAINVDPNRGSHRTHMVTKSHIQGRLSLDLPRVYLVRHGETPWTLTGQHTGRTDLPLTDDGERQACALGPTLAALRIDRIFSSPLQQARRTAELAMPDSRVESDDDLMEWDYGAYDGRRTTEIEMERPGWRLFRDGCPNGETLDSVGARADRVIGRILALGGNVLLFGHREILRILAVRWIGLSPIEGRRLQLATASLSILGYDHDLTEPAIHAWNASAGDGGQETK